MSRIAIDDIKLKAALVGLVADAGSQQAAAKQLGISSQYLRDILQDRRPVRALAGRLGYRASTIFIASDTKPPITDADAAAAVEGLCPGEQV